MPRTRLPRDSAARPGRMSCKDYFQAQKCFECLSLSVDPEQALDELRLPRRVSAV